MKKLFNLFIVIAFFVNIAYAQNNTLTLQKAIFTGLNNNSNIKAAQQMLDSYSYNASAAKSGYLPRIDVVALATRIDNPINLDLNDIRKAIISASAASFQASTHGSDPSTLIQSLQNNIPSFEKKF